MTDLKIGSVTHYYDKIGVAIIELDSDLAKGDKVKFVRGGEDLFDQEIDSIQVEHKNIDKAGKGDVVGIKAVQELKAGSEVWKLD